MAAGGAAVRAVPSDALTASERESLHALFAAAWANEDATFTELDWEHAFGGMHLLVEEDGAIVSHASVVPRRLSAGGIPVFTGYVEAVATWPQHRGRGHATASMRAVGAHLDATYELGALDTGIRPFYERLGWRVWRGPTSVSGPSGAPVPTPEEDGSVMVRDTPATPALDPIAVLACDWRAGDVW